MEQQAYFHVAVCSGETSQAKYVPSELQQADKQCLTWSRAAEHSQVLDGSVDSRRGQDSALEPMVVTLCIHKQSSSKQVPAGSNILRCCKRTHHDSNSSMQAVGQVHVRFVRAVL